jgi:hypothetical protein
MGDNSDIVMEFLKDGPKNTNELSLMMFERKYTCKDKDTCDERTKIIWGKRKVHTGLMTLRNFGLVDYIQNDKKSVRLKTWYLIEK